MGISDRLLKKKEKISSEVAESLEGARHVKQKMASKSQAIRYKRSYIPDHFDDEIASIEIQNKGKQVDLSPRKSRVFGHNIANLLILLQESDALLGKKNIYI